ncbi:hypothetical protein FDECE_3408 [Fusarium decemcellulare]|nr:hypothetical protein FDECE_3408 [Fusarium decemcellulare]
MAGFTGWKLTAVYLTALVTTLTTLLIVTLFVSLFALKKDNGTGEGTESGLGQSLLYEGKCDVTSRSNLWIHLAINIIGTGVLASSNFFMQSLVAPTRPEVDKAHALGHWVEIGVQSIRNFRFIGWRKILFWCLFSLSSVPLHLVFNGTVLESKGTNGFTLLVAAQSFIDNEWKGLAPITQAFPGHQVGDPRTELYYTAYSYNSYDGYDKETVKKISSSLLARNETNDWEYLDPKTCINRYNDPKSALTHYRHVVMMIQNYNDVEPTPGWKLSQVLKNTTNLTNTDSVNPLWSMNAYSRTGRLYSNTYISDPGGNGMWVTNEAMNTFDVHSGLIVMDRSYVKAPYQVMDITGCWSEIYEAPCRLSIANTLLLIVCIMCLFKCLLCFIVLRLRVWGEENPLMTPGDAIASFIATPDEETKGMCTLSMNDLKTTQKHSNSNSKYKWLQGPRPWKSIPKRTFGKAVPLNIWILSSALIGSSLIVAAVMLSLAISGQSLKDARFGHSPQNEDVASAGLENMSLIELTMVANLPQLILSICYMSYNGLFTRMLAEFEWSKYSVEFRALRVTEPKGKQSATYRLQLPYRFSIPLIIVSTVLHWMYSNCIYVSNYEAFRPQYPYPPEITVGLQFSSKAILIALVVSITVAITPIFLAFIRLPGITVISGGNSAVISAACHIPSLELKSLSRTTSKMSKRSSIGRDFDSVSTQLIDNAEDELEAVAKKKVKWGQVSGGKSDDSQTGHLAFGTEEHEVTEPVDGEFYSGI